MTRMTTMTMNRTAVLRWLLLGCGALLVAGCNDGSIVGDGSSVCSQDRIFAHEGEDYCIVIEEGFQDASCPGPYANGTSYGDFVVCARQATALPATLEVEVRSAGFAPKQVCTSDDECGAGTVCESVAPTCDGESICVSGCREDSGCDTGERCNAVTCVTCPCPGICEKDGVDPPTGCKDDSECPEGQVCESGGANCDEPQCVQGCHENNDCPAGDVCTQVTCVTCPCPGVCETPTDPPKDCKDDGECPSGQVCEPSGPNCGPENECVDGCHDNDDCGADEMCAIPTCVTCPCPGMCIKDVVDPPKSCQNDSECPAGQVCEPSGSNCGTESECVPGCHDNDDCGADELCAIPACVTCPCPGICEKKVTDPPPAGCKDDSECPTGQICEPSSPGCEPDSSVCIAGCNDDSDCRDNQTCSQPSCLTCPCPGECLDKTDPPSGCKDNSECPEGQVCEPTSPGCEPDSSACMPGCSEDADCEGGQRCHQPSCLTCPCPGTCL